MVKLTFASQISDFLVKKLEEASIKHDFVEVNEYQRQIGKTTALIEFARKYGFTVVVLHHCQAQELRNITGYKHIIYQGQTYLYEHSSNKIVFDEGVDLRKLKRFNFEIITGYVRA